jgi:hypothetical protein
MRFPLTEVLRRAGEYFMAASPIHKAALALAERLEELGIPYAIAGALAVNAHGRLRSSQDVDVLLTPEGLASFKQRWLGRGWVEKVPGSRGLRDAVHDVPIDVLLTGDFPGDGKPKPIAFPHPGSVSEMGEDGLRVLNLKTLMELKIASGMTAPHRPRDLDDAIQLIRVNRLPREYGESLNPFVQERFLELWKAAQIEEEP